MSPQKDRTPPGQAARFEGNDFNGGERGGNGSRVHSTARRVGWLEGHIKPTLRHSADEYQDAVCAAVRMARFGCTGAGLTRARIAVLRLRAFYDVIPGWAEACDELLRLLAERRRIAAKARAV